MVMHVQTGRLHSPVSLVTRYRSILSGQVRPAGAGIRQWVPAPRYGNHARFHQRLNAVLTTGQVVRYAANGDVYLPPPQTWQVRQVKSSSTMRSFTPGSHDRTFRAASGTNSITASGTAPTDSVPTMLPPIWLMASVAAANSRCTLSARSYSTLPCNVGLTPRVERSTRVVDSSSSSSAVFGQRWLRHAETARGAAKTALLDRGDKRLQRVEFHRLSVTKESRMITFGYHATFVRISSSIARWKKIRFTWGMAN